ncbi:cholesterol catabolism transcriptional regulator KstR [Amycolatopsis magusensis]|uniref:AcrR family transcriptional regulator n=1 Tax=Amycolatopsis magusensis TaxID=882444 RepID=A0ABS4Q2N9_9PSEU|nr:cholesterol catabolism transcriptional regulator KstR [Amycolatopsis magusensis]MBP2185952.1 AcrR family transcriptional regulator [Amycolatopsis magusensis]MDI5977731.1 cholesterol catabolism transcriptional regulator KstR [Amycolatopsis magusensis]UJW28154.1 cholesterol catabolism transcriptional regulator KstR [Saccharothrix sp. AJ9571]
MSKQKAPMGTLNGDELGSAAQRDRRKRIVDATLALASKGGYDAVQMRAVAERADVALGTLYRYFPSKIHLLVSGLAREFERAQEKLQRGAIPGDSPTERLLFVLGRNTRLMQRDPHLTEAMVRAFMFADTTAATEVEHVGRLMENMFATAMGIDDPTEADRDIFHVIADVWMANLVAWVTRRASAADVANRLELSVHLLLDK